MTSRRHGLGILLALAHVVALAGCSRDKEQVATPEPSERPASAAPHDPTPIVPAKHVVPASGSELVRSCTGICERAAKLGCKRADACQENCVAMASTGLCDAELGAFYTCLKGQPSDHWECLEDGTAAIREGYCENEQATFARCLQQN